MIVFCMISWLYFQMSTLVFYCLAYFCVFFSLFISLFSSISRRFVTRTRVDDDILDFSGLSIALATMTCYPSTLASAGWNGQAI